MMPAVWIAEAALVLTAVRLWVMYYPRWVPCTLGFVLIHPYALLPIFPAA